jgi:hypothetical protein
MLNFFRKTRKKLTDDNKPVKYFRYAIGEILLVVIGILIALQVNNWNEMRKVRGNEKNLLKELRVELIHNKDDIVQTIVTIENSIKSNEIIATLFDNNQPYQDSLSLHFARLYSYSFFIANHTTYDNLKETGIDIIQNEEIKNGISYLYTFDFTKIQRMEDLYMHEHYVNYIKPIYMKEFTTFDWPNSLKIRDYESFIHNSNIKQVINYSISNLGNISRVEQEVANKIDGLIALIDKELNKR